MYNCAICLDKIDSHSLYKDICCKGTFHFECLEQWFKIKNTCPLCRREYSHMNHYSSEFEEHLEQIKNINMKQVISNISENVNIFKQHMKDMNLKKMENFCKHTESFLEVLQEFYDNNNNN